MKLFIPFLGLILLATLALTGCSSSASADDHTLAMAFLDQMPDKVQSAPEAVRQSYQFAVANPEVLEQIPCYCGCGAMGHKSNYACYVSGTSPAGEIQFDEHALGCSICVDITQDTMRLLSEGKDVPAIRAYVDSTYAQYGPSNIP